MAETGADGEVAADGDAGTEGAHEPRECMACRGTGQVISNLGGSESRVSCPWCAGSGVRRADIDAQAAWAGAGEGAPEEGAATKTEATGAAGPPSA